MEYVPEIRLFRWFVQAQAILYAKYVLLYMVLSKVLPLKDCGHLKMGC